MSEVKNYAWPITAISKENYDAIVNCVKKNNDLFSVDGLREDRANYLLSLIDDDFKYTLLLEDETGIGNCPVRAGVLSVLQDGVPGVP